MDDFTRDEMQALPRLAIGDRDNIDQLNELAQNTLETDPEQAAVLSQRAYELSQPLESLDNPHLEAAAKSLRLIGSSNCRLGNRGMALSQLLNSLALYQRLEDQARIAALLRVIGMTYHELGDHVNAVSATLRSIKLSEVIEDQESELKSLCNLGIMHHKSGDYLAELNAYARAAEISDRPGLLDQRAILLNNMAVAQIAMMHHDEALDTALRSQQIAEDLGYQPIEATTLCTIGEIHLEKGKYVESLESFEKALDIARQIEAQELEMSVLMGIGKLYVRQGRANQAILILLEALDIAAGIKASREQYECHYLLMDACRQEGDLKAALEHFEQFHGIKEAVANKESGEKLRHLIIAHGAETARSKAESLRHNNQTLRSMNEALQKGEHTLKSTIDAMPLGVVVMQLDGSVYCNPKLSEIVGRELTPENMQQFIENYTFRKGTIEHYPIESMPGSLAIKKHKIHVNDVEVLTPDGSRVPLEIWASPVLDDQGNVKATVSAIAAVSQHDRIQNELIEARREAELANQVKSTFLADMSHEIRTPLNAILGFAQIISQSEELQGIQKRNIETIIDSGNHLLDLINHVLEISKIEAGHVALDETIFSLDGLCQTINAMFSQIAASAGLKFTVEQGSDMPVFFRGDEGRIRQIVVNLVGNALKFTSRGQVGVKISQERTSSKHMVIEVTDTGRGIPSNKIKEMFQSFTQLEGDEGQGTGLGLAICQSYASLMGGSISVMSELGKGSLFRVRLPVQEATDIVEQQYAFEAKVTGIESSQKIPRVLIVDDNASARAVLSQLLLSVGFQVEEATDGKEAVVIYPKYLPDVILMDLQMPNMDGYEAIRQIDSIADNKPFFIVISGNVFEADVNGAYEAGADGFLKKPFHLATVLEEIGRVTGLHYTYDHADDQGGDDADIEFHLNSLGKDQIATLRDAVLRADLELFTRILNDIEGLDANTVNRIGLIAKSFNYEKLLELLPEYLETRNP